MTCLANPVPERHPVGLWTVRDASGTTFGEGTWPKATCRPEPISRGLPLSDEPKRARALPVLAHDEPPSVGNVGGNRRCSPQKIRLVRWALSSTSPTDRFRLAPCPPARWGFDLLARRTRREPNCTTGARPCSRGRAHELSALYSEICSTTLP